MGFIAGELLNQNADLFTTDLAENEMTEEISFNVDHTFVQPPPVISKEKKEMPQTSLLIIVSTIVIAAIVISVAVKKTRKTSVENKILKEDL